MPHAVPQTLEQQIACLEGQRATAQLLLVNEMQENPIDWSKVLTLIKYVLSIDKQLDALGA